MSAGEGQVFIGASLHAAGMCTELVNVQPQTFTHPDTIWASLAPVPLPDTAEQVRIFLSFLPHSISLTSSPLVAASLTSFVAGPLYQGHALEQMTLSTIS